MKITPQEIAKMANVDPWAVDYWRKSNKISGIRVSGRWYYEKDEVAAYIVIRNQEFQSRREKERNHLDKGILCLECGTKTRFTNQKQFTRQHLKPCHSMSPQNYYEKHILKNMENVCSICGKEKTFLSISRGYLKYCTDNVCNGNNPEIVKKIGDSKLNKYGDVFYTNKEKSKVTCLEKYGVSHYTNRLLHKITWEKKTPEEKEKHKYLTLLAKKEKYLKTLSPTLEKYKCHLLTYKSEEVELQCKICDSITTITTKHLYNRCVARDITPCFKCQPLDSHASSRETDLLNFLKEYYHKEIDCNNRKLIGKEVDLFLPDINLAIEYNGSYWHSDNFKDRHYHEEKTKLCADKGVRLLHVFEDEWHNKNKIIKDKIVNILGKTPNRIFARKCEIKIVSDVETQKKFLNQNHIQGWTPSKLHIGLYFNSDLCGLMSFAKPRTNKDFEWELVRYATLLNHVVPGGGSKLFKYFIENFNPTSIISYADNTWSVGNLYETIGFVKNGISKPSYFYVDKRTGIRYHRFNFNKKRLLYLNLINSGETESQAMLRLNTHHKIFDCGKIRYIWRKL